MTDSLKDCVPRRFRKLAQEYWGSKPLLWPWQPLPSPLYAPEMVVAAAKTAGVHDMILHLPDGYDTIIGGAGGVLSGGERQRIGLARAIYGQPRLLVLDEPNSNLDDKGEKELINALRRIKVNGSTVVIITHRTLVLQCVDKILVMKEGMTANFGPKEQVLAKLMQHTAVPQVAAN